MNALSNANSKSYPASRGIPADLERRHTVSDPRSMDAENDQNLVEFDYDNGYPEGFTISDNRDIWQGEDEDGFKKLTFSPRTLGVWVVLKSFRPGWVIRVSHLRRVLGMGRDTLRATLAELEKEGRLKRVQVRNADGKYGRQRWVLRRGGLNCLPPSTPPTPEFQAPVDTDDGKAGEGPAPESQAPVDTEDGKAGEGPAPESQPPASASGSEAGSGLAGAGISAPLVTTEVISNTEVTTTQPASPPRPGLVPPLSLPSSEAQVVVEEVEKALRKGDLCADLAQPILDELEGAVRRGQRGRPIEKPVSYLRSLLGRAQSGQFVPDAGLPILRERQKQALELEKRACSADQRQQRHAKRSAPEAQRRIKQNIADCYRALGITPGPHRDSEPRRRAFASP